MSKRRRAIETTADASASASGVELRIIGGTMRGRKILYAGDPRTRPMKDRVREAVFNLVGPSIRGKLAIDLFAGTGALGLEALSRGAARAVFIERHFPTAALVRRNAEQLGVGGQCEVVPGDAFIWARRPAQWGDSAWVVFCSPPYDLYQDRQADLLALLNRLAADAPPQSALVVEADERFDMTLLPRAAEWDVRHYPPAVVGILRV